MYTWEDGGRPEIKLLKRTWLQANPQYEIEDPPIGIGAIKPLPDEFVIARNFDQRIFIEFRVKPPTTIDVDLRARHECLVLLGLNHIVVVPRSKIDALAQSSYEASSILLEPMAGTFETSTQLLTLRPENTAGVVRAYIEHKLGDTGQLQKLFYIGPQFRRERPQRGRYRQFWQIGAEVLGPVSSGAESAIRDAEVLEMLATLLDELGVTGWRLEVNSVGSATDRPRYVAALREALAPIKHQMCEDNQRRAETNPLRVLDSKDPNDQELINGLPKIADYLDEASTDHFRQVLAALDAAGVPYHVNPRLVRGLDYYTRTTFEFTVPDGSGLGTQNALLGGGRYDGLSEMLGGPKAPGIGFAIGEDRLILTLEAQAKTAETKKLDAYIAPMGTAQNAAALALARELRRAGLSVELGDGSFRLKKSFEAADKAARRVVILGEDELTSGILTVKTFATGDQTKVARTDLSAFLQS
ncbi:histidine--tRNA ligase [Granulicella sp. WH15]|uniref:histidine--tRNA ligase n=1 Tax=Granulicella sp. WH15 TaxID=2602070 RepID=UPI0021062AC6|nr:histidine--tRNA ligase [Granulicella sp. WH15]